MIKKPAQHTALTFLTQKGMGVITLLLVVLLFPVILLFFIGLKVGLVLGLHFIIDYLTGSWAVLYLFGVLVGLFTVLGFVSRTAELGRYFTGLKLYVKDGALKAWYYLVFTVDFLVTDMLTLTAAAVLAYVYWMAAATQSYAVFYAYAQPFIALSILGGLLQILFSSYYLTHKRLQKIYIYATGDYFSPLARMKSSKKRSSKKRKASSKKRVAKQTKKRRKAVKRKTTRKKRVVKKRRTKRRSRR